MVAVFIIGVGLVLLFGMVLGFGAPYLPTLRPQTQAALELLDLKPGQTLIELGSGDGTIIKAAAKQGLHVVGYELNPLLVVVSYVRTFKYRGQIKIIWGNFWVKQWPQADGLYIFLIDKYMQRLDKKIAQTYSGRNIKLASLAFKIPGRKITRQKDGVYLYEFRGSKVES